MNEGTKHTFALFFEETCAAFVFAVRAFCVLRAFNAFDLPCIDVRFTVARVVCLGVCACLR